MTRTGAAQAVCGGAAMAVCASWIAGCAAPGAGAAVPVTTDFSTVRAETGGLETWSFAIPDAPRAAPRLLARYADRPVPLPREVVERWRVSGLRIVSVPAADIGPMVSEARSGVRGEVSTLGTVQKQWLGLFPEWAELVRGREYAGGSVVEIDGGTLELGAGRARLLGRCWVVPADETAGPESGAAPRAALRLEIVPQYRDAGSPLRRLERQVGIAPRPSPVDEGLLFRRLAAELTLTGDDALVIVAEDPATDWGTPAVREESRPADLAEAGAPEEETAPPAPTLGRALLTAPSPGEGRVGMRTVLVLLPRVPEKFTLFAD